MRIKGNWGGCTLEGRQHERESDSVDLEEGEGEQLELKECL